MSGYEAQLTRCRALLEKGEAQKQTLEYELAVVKRDAAAQRDKLANLITHNQQLEGACVYCVRESIIVYLCHISTDVCTSCGAVSEGLYKINFVVSALV